MDLEDREPRALFRPLTLPCGAVLKTRIAKAAMSDSLGDGRGAPTNAQMRLYERWAEGGAALSIVGEVQGDPRFAEKPGNLVLAPEMDEARFAELARRGGANGCALFAQLGHAGAMAHPPISTPKGPSALDLPGLTCEALTPAEIEALPAGFARTAAMAQRLGFAGVQVHAAHGFLFSQFLSPLFNRRTDRWGGSLANRMRVLAETIAAVRAAVGPTFPVALKLNATDQLDGGLTEAEALDIIAALDGAGLDLIDISGGTYFPGAASASDRRQSGPYFVDFARRARARTTVPLMVTGGFKRRTEAIAAVTSGTTDMVGLARALVLDPDLPNRWRMVEGDDPAFPRFASSPDGGVTAWYTMRLTALGEDRVPDDTLDAHAALAAYEARDANRVASWNARFAG
ncbi:NADH:flavin oxidoreductase/NADH oxidase family protein [Roseitalea porphyridii]|uniref:NADH:flavin oxidoreductase/NADH oxidase family protein n=1 Tax=Roseitalea porphyridii TaxID=1852022 RepID=A0A4P6UYN8_9HYPH|nr:NADH:flavin oxidoreductase/NADH oxidase family protein [Roseitalea porphyridii]QBK30161.1 NADH:flavin oxidoreductase/NADH oxidase family protein [Roseitalea porphyridii]